jgi:plastocyanin
MMMVRYMAGILVLCILLGALGCDSHDAPPPRIANRDVRYGEQADSGPSFRSSVGVSEAGKGGMITGVVRFEGALPRPKQTKLSPDCANCAPGPIAPDEAMILGDGNIIQNAVVSIDAVGEGGFSFTADPVTIDQKGCVYSPHVVAVNTAQKISFSNSDPLVHNVLLKGLVSMNKGHESGAPPIEVPLPGLAGYIGSECSYHSWMGCHIHIFDHPYFALTGADGRFSLKNVPAGTYRIKVWQEVLGVATQVVTVPEAGTVTADFALKK